MKPCRGGAACRCILRAAPLVAVATLLKPTASTPILDKSHRTETQSRRQTLWASSQGAMRGVCRRQRGQSVEDRYPLPPAAEAIEHACSCLLLRAHLSDD